MIRRYLLIVAAALLDAALIERHPGAAAIILIPIAAYTIRTIRTDAQKEEICRSSSS